MANEFLFKTGTPITWKAAGGDYAMTMASIIDNAAQQGAKADLGAVRAARWAMRPAINMDAAPAAGKVIELYWSSSPSAVAGAHNTGACSGTDAAYTGSAGGTVDETKPQLLFVDVLVLTPDADAVVQIAEFIFFPPQRYGMPVLVNKSGQALEGDDDSHQIAIYPLIDEVQ